MIRFLSRNAFLVILPSLRYLEVSLRHLTNEQQAVDLDSKYSYRETGNWLIARILTCSSTCLSYNSYIDALISADMLPLDRWINCLDKVMNPD